MEVMEKHTGFSLRRNSSDEISKETHKPEEKTQKSPVSINKEENAFWALKSIANLCAEHLAANDNRCAKCPLYNGTKCSLKDNNTSPKDWNLVPPPKEYKVFG